MKGFIQRIRRAIIFLSAAFFACILSVLPLQSAYANSAAPWEEGVTGDGVYIVRDESVLEVQSEKLTFDIQTLPSLAQGQIYDARVTAEYTFYNPTTESLTTQMAFPFGRKPNYAEYLSVAYIEDPVLVNGQSVGYDIRHTYGRFTEFYESVSEIREDYIADDFYVPDLPVTIYTAKVNFTDSADMDGKVALRLDSAPALGEGTRCMGPFSLDRETSDYSVWQVVSDGESVVFYVMGEDVPLDGWGWFTSAWSDSENAHIAVQSDISFSSSKTTLGQLIFSNYSDEYQISRVDWYNAAMLHKLSVERGEFSYLSWYSPLKLEAEDFNAWYVYTVQTAPHTSFTNAVTAPLYPTVHFSFDPDVYEYVYYLSPAANWADFGTLDIVVNTPYYMYAGERYNSATFIRTEGGYSARFETLPDGELYFSLCSVENPGRDNNGSPGGNNPAFAVIYVLIAVGILLVLAAVVLTVIFIVRRRRKCAQKEDASAQTDGDERG